MEKLNYENILTNITLHQIDSTSLHLLFQRNFTFNKCDKLSRFSLSLPDIHLELVFINDVLICQTLCPITLIYNYRDIIGNHFWEVHRRCHREKWQRIFKQIQRIK
jgi:hypothetical protein